MKNKFNDPTIKEDMKKFGDNIANKSKQISEKSMHMAKKGYESVKKVRINYFDNSLIKYKKIKGLFKCF